MRSYHHIHIYLFVVALIIVFTSCALFIKTPVEPGLEQMSEREVHSYEWVDDLNSEGLEQAVAQSIRYFKRLPSGRTIRFGDIIYSPEEMAASLNLFLDIMKNLHGEHRRQELTEKFLFFESKNSDGDAFFTGYYEPVLEGSLVPTDEFPEPLYKTPDDLIAVDLGQFNTEWDREFIVGKLEGSRLIPYDSRDQIVNERSLIDRAEIIAYLNEIELFFLQIQGSGLIKLRDGSIKRVNYAQKNGHPYRAIGRILEENIPPDKMSLQSIKEYLYANPGEVGDILSYNQSYTFFREVEEGPLGSIEVPLTPDRSIAMDKRVIPGGILAFVETEFPVFSNDRIVEWKSLSRFVLVQDTGGAIREHGRVDIFFGRGEKAGLIAGHLKQKGRVFIIVARKEFLSSYNSRAH